MSNFCCPCNCENIGGVSVSGSAIVFTGKLAEGFETILPLIELSEGIEGEFEDVSGKGNNGTGGDGSDPETIPFQSSGVACQSAQLGTNGRQFIRMNADSIPANNPFSLSIWVNLDGRFSQNPIYQRGSFSVFASYLNNVTAQVNQEGQVYSAYSQQQEEKSWYHLGITVIPTKSITIFVNGIQAGSCDLPIDELLLSEENYIGKVNSIGRGFKGKLQDFRLSYEIRSADWFLAEYQNYCSNFFEVT